MPQKLLHNAGPRSLQFQRQPAEELASEARRGLAVRAVLMLGGYYSRESQHMRAAKRLYEAVKEQAVAPSFLQGACRAGGGTACVFCVVGSAT